MHTFYIQEIGKHSITLPESESKHAIKVLRLSTGSSIRLVDGKGTEAIGTIGSTHPKHTEVLIREWNQEEKPKTDLTIVLAPTKSNDRTEWFLEKAIEIGLTKFIPVICNNSERKKFNPTRWEKIAIAALKQSKRLWLPEIVAPINFPEVMKMDFPGKKWIAHCENEKKEYLSNVTDQTVSQTILIGPEGDFSPEEILLAKEQDFIPISLGDNRLRTETAGVVACTLMKMS